LLIDDDVFFVWQEKSQMASNKSAKTEGKMLRTNPGGIFQPRFEICHILGRST
jgi:hypothetical protein